jgi:hypothetical protein
MGYKVADLSSWGGELTDAEAEAFKDYGIRLVVVNTWGQWTRQQAEMAVKHGLALEAYTYHYLSLDPTTRTEQGIAKMAGFPVARYWQDYEDEIEGYSTREVVAHIRQAIAACDHLGVAAGIYTRRGWWEPNTDGCTEFSHLPLWDAFYDGVPSMDYFRKYSGWEKPLMKQYTGTESVGGQTLDLSWREDQEEPMTDADKTELALRRAAAGLQKALADLKFQDVANAMAVYLGVRAS